QKVREAAARMSCQNNLKQIALANMNYESENGTFLPGVGKNGCCWGTWMIPILPYMEQQALFNMYVNFGGLDYSGPRYGPGPVDNPNNRITSTPLKAFTCPSDTPQPWNERRSGLAFTKHNYVLNAGNTTFYQVPLPLGCTIGTAGCTPFLGAPFGWYNDSNLNNDSTFPYDQPSPPGPNKDNGKMGKQSNSVEITAGDGTSNTMMASEVIHGRAP